MIRHGGKVKGSDEATPLVAIPPGQATPIASAPRLYAASRTLIAPSGSKLIIKGSAVVVIGVERRIAGRDNGSVVAGARSEDTRRRCWVPSTLRGCVNRQLLRSLPGEFFVYLLLVEAHDPAAAVLDHRHARLPRLTHDVPRSSVAFCVDLLERNPTLFEITLHTLALSRTGCASPLCCARSGRNQSRSWRSSKAVVNAVGPPIRCLPSGIAREASQRSPRQHQIEQEQRSNITA